MLIEAYSYAIKNREKLLESIKTISPETYKRAVSSWINYSPENLNMNICAIDSSWNYSRYHGFYLYAIEGVSVLPDNSFAAEPLYDVGLSSMIIDESGQKVSNPNLWMASRGMDFEYSLALTSSVLTDYVLVDGSLLARYYDRRERKIVGFYEHAEELLKKENIIFVAKNSESTSVLDGPIGDIFYFDKATNKSGYSKPHYDKIGITVFYARLDDYEPCLRIEVPGQLNEEECKRIYNVVSSKRLNGYPYALYLAHNRCKISNEDIERLVNVLGLDIELGSREVLKE